jgi:hypothetical protein
MLTIFLMKMKIKYVWKWPKKEVALMEEKTLKML